MVVDYQQIYYNFVLIKICPYMSNSHLLTRDNQYCKNILVCCLKLLPTVVTLKAPTFSRITVQYTKLEMQVHVRMQLIYSIRAAFFMLRVKRIFKTCTDIGKNNCRIQAEVLILRPGVISLSEFYIL
jgi:hypothetical protein